MNASKYLSFILLAKIASYNWVYACSIDVVELRVHAELVYWTDFQDTTENGSLSVSVGPWSDSGTGAIGQGEVLLTSQSVKVIPTQEFSVSYNHNVDSNLSIIDASFLIEIPACYNKISIDEIIYELGEGPNGIVYTIDLNRPDAEYSTFGRMVRKDFDQAVDINSGHQVDSFDETRLIRINYRDNSAGANDSIRSDSFEVCLLPDQKEEDIQCAAPRTGKPDFGPGDSGPDPYLESDMGLGPTSSGSSAGILQWMPSSLSNATDSNSLSVIDVTGAGGTTWSGDQILVGGQLRAERSVLAGGDELKIEFYEGASVTKTTRILQNSSTEVQYITSAGGVVDQDFVISYDSTNKEYSYTDVLGKTKSVTILDELVSGEKVETEEEYYDVNGDGTYAASELVSRIRTVTEDIGSLYFTTSSINDPDDSNTLLPGRAGGEHLVTTYIYDTVTSPAPPVAPLLVTIQPDGGWSATNDAIVGSLTSYLGLPAGDIRDVTFSGYQDAAAPSDGFLYDPSASGNPAGATTFDDVVISIERINGDSESYLGNKLLSRSRSVYTENVTFDSLAGLKSGQSIRFYGSGATDFDGSLSGVTYSYPGGWDVTGEEYLRGKIYARVNPDGSRTTYSYEKGTLDETTFTFAAGAGPDYQITATEGTSTSSDGIDGISTQTRTITDEYGRIRVEQTRVRSGGDYDEILLTEISYYNGLSDELERTERHSGAYSSGSGVITYEAEWVAHEIVKSWNEFGVESETVDEGLVGTSYTRDGAIEFATRSTRNIAGRLVSSLDTSGLETTYDYQLLTGGGSEETVVSPNGSKTVTTYRRDGSVLTTQFQDSSGSPIQTVSYSELIANNGAKTVLTTTIDHLSTPSRTSYVLSLQPFDWRISKSYTPTFDQTGASGSIIRMLETINTSDGTGGSVVSRDNTALFDTSSLLITSLTAITNPMADIFSVRDPDTGSSMSGYDVDNSEVLNTETTSLDRVTETISDYYLDGLTWYQRSRNHRWGPSGQVLLSESLTTMDGRYSKFIDHSSGVETTQFIDVFAEASPSKHKKVLVRYGNQDSSEGLEVYAGYNTLLESVQPQNNTTTSGQSDTTGLSKVVYTYDYVSDSDEDPFNDGHKRLIEVTNENGVVSRRAYDETGTGAGQVSTMTEAQGTADAVTTVYTYDAQGQVSMVRGTASYPMDYYYDGFGQLQTLTTYYGQSGNATVTKWLVDPLSGQLTQKLYDAGGGSPKGPSYSYDDYGRLATREWARVEQGSDPVETSYGYNTVGQITSITYDHDNGVTPDVSGIVYDKAGNYTAVTDASGARTGITWSDFNQIETESWSSGLFNGLEVDRNHTDGRRSTLSASRNSNAIYRPVFYEWNAVTKQLDDMEQALNTNNSHRVTYEYLLGTPLTSSVVHATEKNGISTDRHETKYVYDTLGRVDQVKNGLGATAVRNYGPISYDNLNRREVVPESSGERWMYDYNDRGEVINGERLFSSTASDYVPGHRFLYDYDDLGNRLLESSGGDQNGAGMETVSYAPNALNQYNNYETPATKWITGEAAINASVSVNEAPALEFPSKTFFGKKLPLGNESAPQEVSVDIRASLAGAGPGGVDLIKDETGTLLVPPQQVVPSYDDDGNLVEDGLWSYTWNAENRLVTMESLASVPDNAKRQLSFSYDWQGRRIRKVVKSYASGSFSNTLSDRRFLYDGWNLIVEWDEAGGQSPCQNYLWGVDLSGSFQGAGGVGGLLSVSNYTQQTGAYVTFVPSYDSNGNITAVSKLEDTTISTKEIYEYSPFGQLLRGSNATPSELTFANPFRFSTKYRDLESKLYYYGYRYLDPDKGRWVNRDPIEENGGLNIYGFLANDGISKTDRLGLEEVEIWVAAFIKPSSIRFPYPVGLTQFPADHHGDGRGFGKIGGSARVWHRIVVETDENVRKNPIVSNRTDTGASTVKYKVRGAGFTNIVTKTDKVAPPKLAKVKRLDIATVELEINASVANPLVKSAPKIDYSYKIVIYGCLGIASVEGSHDRFPWHEVYINQKPFITASPSGPSKTPADLVLSKKIPLFKASYSE